MLLPSSTPLAFPTALQRRSARLPTHTSPSSTIILSLVLFRARFKPDSDLLASSLNEYIALGTYGLVGLGAWAAMRGGDAKKADDSKLDITSQTDECVPLAGPVASFPRTDCVSCRRNSKEMIAFIENFINNEEHKAKSQAGH